MDEKITTINVSQPSSNFPSVPTGANNKTFLSKLTKDTLLHVIRFMSREPRSDNWVSFVHSADVLTLLNCEGPLGSCAQNIFCALEQHDVRPSITKGAVVIGKRREFRKKFSKLVEAAGDCVQEITISREWGKQHRLFLDKYPRLHSVSLTELNNRFGFLRLKRILPATLESVRKIKLTLRHLSPSDIEALRRNFNGLKSLTLKIETTSEGLEKVWATVGDTLEHLSLSCSRYNSNPFRLHAIGEQCPNIKRLEFEDFPHHAQEDLSSLCVGYGTRLQSLRLYSCNISSEYLGLIALGCKNLSLNFSEWMHNCFSSLVLISPLVSTLEVFDRDCDDWPGIPNAVPCFRNLTHMTWNSHIGVHFDRLRSVLSKSLSNLSVLRISFHGMRDCDAHELMNNVFPFLSGPSISLEEFYYDCCIHPTAQALSTFLVSNPRLQKLHFEGLSCLSKYWHYEQFSDYYALVSSALEAPRLKELRMLCWPSHEGYSYRNQKIAEICSSSGKRNTCISICRYIYS